MNQKYLKHFQVSPLMQILQQQKAKKYPQQKFTKTQISHSKYQKSKSTQNQNV